MAESERVGELRRFIFPSPADVISSISRYSSTRLICEENGLRNDSIIMRMTGCPNGCARPGCD
jgi:hypothetical protein